MLAACGASGPHSDDGRGASSSSGETPGSATLQDEPRPLLGMGGDHVCVLKDTGRVWCWGSNLYLQLGDGFRPIESKPVQIPGVEDATDIAADGQHTCVVTKSGEVACWGGKDLQLSMTASNLGGQIDTTTRPTHALAKLPGVSTAKKVAVGWAENGLAVVCVLLGDGTVKCKGPNHYGTVGDGTKEDRDEPVTVQGLTDVVDLATDGRCSCALKSNARVVCWGSFGENTELPGPLAKEVEGLPSMKRLLRSSGTCGLTTDDHVVCWGGAPKEPPKPLEGFDRVKRMAGRCAIDESGRVRCKGTDSNGATGRESGDDKASAVVEGFETLGLGHPVDIASNRVTCVTYDTGAVACMGKNGEGQLGIGESVEVHDPVDVVGVDSATSVVALDYAGCALESTGEVKCWGAGSNTNDFPPEATRGTTVTGLTNATKLFPFQPTYVQSTWIDLCATTKDDGLACFSAAGGKIAPKAVKIRGIDRVEGLASGAREGSSPPTPAYVIQRGGEVSAWIPLEDGDDLKSWSLKIPALTGMTQILVRDEACGVRKDGTVACWLPAPAAISDEGSVTPSPELLTPSLVAIPNLTGVESIAHGMLWCARTHQGEVFCWSLTRHDRALEGPSRGRSRPTRV
ncbi:MAG: hypothetical protein U0271_11045 [Polyangiaceae bacterium]